VGQGIKTRKPGGLVTPPGALSSSIRDRTHEPNVRIVIKELIKAGRQFAICLTLAVSAALATGGCGAGGGDYGGDHPDYAKALAGSPPQLAALHEQADRLLPGGAEALDKRIASLHGYPAVVNVWASWCGPCRFEFPTLQKLSAAYGKRVAFLGVNSEDSDDAAKTFLEEAPVPYPSYTSGDGGIANELGAIGLPATAFYDRQGKLVFLQQKPYTDDAELRADIERYALGEGNSSESG
jgi:cytochrome c biogenesis protein CcmG/thiol:disulfide interchange protein DsbE